MSVYHVRFRTFDMPCCNHILDWVGSRLPTFCPECGAEVFLQLKTDNRTTLNEQIVEIITPGKDKPDD